MVVVSFQVRYILCRMVWEFLDEVGSNAIHSVASVFNRNQTRDKKGPESTQDEPSSLPPNTVFLNVYDIVELNQILHPMGIGVHHTGIEVYGTEVAFGRNPGGNGVFETTPKVTPPHIFREQLALGQTPLTHEEVLNLIQEFKLSEEDWSGSSYHLIQRNCNNFSEAFARRLLPPDVRVAQRDQISWMGDDGECEDVVLSSGAVTKAPLLVPTWINRLARSAGRWLPTPIIEKLEEADRRAQES